MTSNPNAGSNVPDDMPWILIDLSWLVYRALYTVGGLKYHEEPTGVLFGVLEQLRTICLDPRVQSNKLVVFADSQQSFRRDIFPEYKRSRVFSAEDVTRREIVRKQTNLLLESLQEIGLDIFRQMGLESDDLIARVALDLAGDGQRGIIITADGDLYQCISNAITWYDPSRRKRFDVDSFLKHKGIHPTQWAEVKAIAGCDTDNVPGVPGVGEKTAIDYLNGKLSRGSKRYQNIMSSPTIIVRNRELVTLPRKEAKRILLRTRRMSMEALLNVCNCNGINTYLATGSPRKQEWDSIISGRLSVESRQVKRKRGSSAKGQGNLFHG